MDIAIQLSIALLFGLVWLGVFAWLRLRKRQALAYLAFLTIFCVYLYAVAYYTLIQFQSLLLLKHFLPHLILKGLPAGGSLNLIPLATLTAADLKTSLLNILLFVPFGFGLPFISNLRMKGVVAFGVLFSLRIETLQLVTGLIGGITFRVADINDVIFNSVGAVIGYLLFMAFVHAFRRATHHPKVGAHPLARYLAERLRVDVGPSGQPVTAGAEFDAPVAHSAATRSPRSS
jgi:glycopeptide antibiotics resistance protein